MDEANQLAVKWGVPVAIAFMAVAVRMLFTADRWTLIGIIRGLSVGALVGWMAGLWVWEMDKITFFWLIDVNPFTSGQKGCVIGVFAMLAEDIVMSTILIGRKLRDDPLGFLSIIFNWRQKP